MAILSIRIYFVVPFCSSNERLQTGRASDINERRKMGISKVPANFVLWVLPGIDWTKATAGTASAVTARWLEPMMWFDHLG
jgi:hypothetical protein